MAIGKIAAQSFADDVMAAIPIKNKFMREGELKSEMRDAIHAKFLPDDVKAMLAKYPLAFSCADSIGVMITMRYFNNKSGWTQSNVYPSFISCGIDKQAAKAYVTDLFCKAQDLAYEEFIERQEMHFNTMQTVLALNSWRKVKEAMPELEKFIPAAEGKAMLPAAKVSDVVNSLLSAGLKVEAAHV